MQQVKLASTTYYMILWVEDQFAKKGKRLTDGNREWEVVEVYKGLRLDKKDLKTDWKVGGLM